MTVQYAVECIRNNRLMEISVFDTETEARRYKLRRMKAGVYGEWFIYKRSIECVNRHYIPERQVPLVEDEKDRTKEGDKEDGQTGEGKSGG